MASVSIPRKPRPESGDTAATFGLLGGGLEIKKVEATVGQKRSWSHQESRHFILAHAGGRMHGLETSIGGRTQRCAPPVRGQLWIVPAGAGYASHASGDRISYCAAFVSPGLIAQIAPAASAHSDLASAVSHHDEYLFQLIMRLGALASEADDLSRMSAETGGLALCQHLARDYSGVAVLPRSRGPRLDPSAVKLLEEFVADHISEPMRLDQLAALVGLPTHQFMTAFRAHFDTTPVQYIIRRRLSLAAWLLESTTDEISDIALNCGFSSHSHLSTAFAKQFGVPPSRYRQARRQ